MHFCIYVYIVEISPSVYVWLKFVSSLDQDSPRQRARGKRACSVFARDTLSKCMYHIRIYIYTCICIYKNMYANINVYVYRYVYIYKCIYIYTRIFMYMICIYMYLYIHIYMYLCIYGQSGSGAAAPVAGFLGKCARW